MLGVQRENVHTTIRNTVPACVNPGLDAAGTCVSGQCIVPTAVKYHVLMTSTDEDGPPGLHVLSSGDQAALRWGALELEGTFVLSLVGQFWECIL